MTDTPPPDGYRPCVGLALTNPAGLLWAGERIGQPGAWQMPQGGMDPGETAEEAGLRELREETGLRADSVRLIGRTTGWLTYDLPPEIAARMWKGRYVGQAQIWLHLTYDGPDSAVDLDHHEKEFETWDWLDAKTILDRIVPFKRDIYERALSRLSLWP